MTKKIDPARRLMLNKTTLRQLSDGELRRAAGGNVSQDAGPGGCDGATDVACPTHDIVCDFKRTFTLLLCP